MTISKLIEELQKIKEQVGDKEVIMKSYDGGGDGEYHANVYVNFEGRVEIIPRGEA